jgi:hypothetical protein
MRRLPGCWCRRQQQAAKPRQLPLLMLLQEAQVECSDYYCKYFTAAYTVLMYGAGQLEAIQSCNACDPVIIQGPCIRSQQMHCALYSACFCRHEFFSY